MSRRSGGGIDYSKWDKFQDEDDSDSDQHNDLKYSGGRSSLAVRQQQQQPVVTKFDTPRRVTALGDGETLLIEPSLSSSPSSKVQSVTTTTKEDSNSIENSGNTTATSLVTQITAAAAESMTTINITKSTSTTRSDATTASPQIPASWTDKGGHVRLPSLSHYDDDNTKGIDLYWSQDRYSVTLRALLPDDATVQVANVQVRGILPYSERCSATARINHPQTLMVRLRTKQQPSQAVPSSQAKVKATDGGMLWCQGDLPHPVHLEE